ncbi:MAG: hypothetical protein M3P06_06725 [Acidobacteriota bacterium]|nr:hypothetical protein [Acidobacteriota bacterium]
MQHLIDALGEPGDSILDALPFEQVPFDEESDDTSLYFVAPEFGVQVATNGLGVVETVWLSSGRDDPGFEMFSGELFDGLTFSSSRDDVRARFGSPSTTGTGDGVLSPHPKIDWDRYDSDRYSVHFEYFAVGLLLRRVTLMAPSTVPTT